MNNKRPGPRSLVAFSLLLTLISGLLTGPRAADAQVEPQATIATISPVSTAADVRVVGARDEDHLSGNGAAGIFTSLTRARAIATGDFNGDNIQDFIVGAPDADVVIQGQSGTTTRANAGAAYVILGRATPNVFPQPIDTDLPAQTSIRIFGKAEGDNLGFAVASGDVNGDGRDDILIGAPGSDFDTNRQDNGAVYIILGQAAAQPATIDLATANAASFVIQGVTAGDNFGSSIAIGNVGGLVGSPTAQQAIRDIIVGAPSHDGPGGARTNAGAAYVVFGSGNIVRGQANATGSLDLAAQGTPANVIVLGQAGDALGSSVAIADVNGASVGDIIVGAPGADRPVRTTPAITAADDAGAVYVVFGGTNINPATGTSRTFDTISSGPQQNLVIYGGNAGDALGFSVAAADVTAAGSADLIAGAPNADGPTNDRAEAGEAYVFAGGSGLDAPAGTINRIDLALANQAVLTVFGQTGERLGSTVAAARINSEGNTDTNIDLLIGSPYASGGRGEVSVILGGSPLTFIANRDKALGQDDIRIIGDAVNDELGWAIAGADLNNDNAGDLIIGAPFADPVPGSTTRTNAGQVYVLLANTVDAPPVNQPPTVTVTAPDGNQTLQAGSTFNIIWTASDPNGNDDIQRFEIRLSLDGGANFPDNLVIALNVPGNVRQFAWTVPVNLNSSTARIRVIAVDSQGARGQDDSNANFTISNAGAVVTLTSPNGGQNLVQGSTVKIMWTVPPEVANQVIGFNLFLITESGVSNIAFNGAGTVAVAANLREFDWVVPAICSTNARIEIEAVLNSGPASVDQSNAAFSISAPGPTLDTTDLELSGDASKLVLLTVAPQGGTEIRFATGVTVAITDATGVFREFAKVRIKKSGRKLLTKGSINSQTLDAFFPNQQVRTLRIVNPTCGVTQIQVRREGNTLVVVTPAAQVESTFN